MNAKAPLVLTTAVLSMALLGACNQGADNGTATAPAGDTTATDAPAAATANTDAMNPGGIVPADPNMQGGTMTEGQALGMVAAVNEAEIKLSEQARSKNVEGPAREYADMMIADHTANMEKLRSLEGSAGVAIDNGGDVASLRQKHQAMMDQLGALEAEAYAKGYIDAMVQSHTEAHGMLEARLIPVATQEPVREHLTMTRDAVAKHLERARELQNQAGAAAAPAQ